MNEIQKCYRTLLTMIKEGRISSSEADVFNDLLERYSDLKTENEVLEKISKEYAEQLFKGCGFSFEEFHRLKKESAILKLKLMEKEKLITVEKIYSDGLVEVTHHFEK